MTLTSGFLVVKRFEHVYAAFAENPAFDNAIYALPLFGTTHERLSIRYRGVDREAVSPHAKGALAEMRLHEINGETFDGSDDFLSTREQALDILAWSNAEMPGVYEVVWARLASDDSPPPAGFELLGFEPTYFTRDHFSAVCDSMCFPRWHGTDREGTLFRAHFERLNANGLFDGAAHAVEFLAYYRSFDWTETGEFEIASVWGAAL